MGSFSDASAGSFVPGEPDPSRPSEIKDKPAPQPNPRLCRARIVRRRRFFDAAFQSGKRTHSRSLTLLIVPRSTGELDEAAFLTPKRLGSAVVRNQLRRRLRESYRLYFVPDPQRRLIWLAKPPAIALDFPSLVKEMKELYVRSIPSR